MSEENVETVRRLYTVAARRDNEAVYALYDPDIVWDASRTERGGMAGPIVRGHEALKKWLRQWYGAWENIEDQLDEVIDAGHEVITVMTQRGSGRGSGVEVADRLATIWVVCGGRITRATWFPTRAEALESAGLRE